MNKRKLIITLEQLKTAIKQSNKVTYPIVFRSAEDFDEFVIFLEKEGLKKM